MTRSAKRQRAATQSPPAIPIILAALLSAAAVQPAGDINWEQCSCAFDQSTAALDYFPTDPFSSHSNLYSNSTAVCGVPCSECNNGMSGFSSCGREDVAEELPALRAHILTLIVRTALILLEFGSRPLKNAKKIMSCAIICLWLYHYRFGISSSRLARVPIFYRDIAAENATFVISFLLLRLALKLAQLLNLFKTWKRLRIVKLLKLAKCAPNSCTAIACS